MNSDAFKIRLKQVMRGESNHSFAAKCGISEGTVRRYLKGDAFPPLDTLQVLATMSGCNLGWLASGEGEMRRGEGEPAQEQPAKVAVPTSAWSLAMPPQPAGGKVDPVMAVIKQELLRMSLDQKRAVLKLCMDITGEQYALVKNSSQSNREQHLKGVLKKDPTQEETDTEEWEW